MWAIEYDRYGPPEVLELRERRAPALREGQVLVRTLASGLSRIDCLYREGAMRLHGVGFPKQTGFDALGQVVESRCPEISQGSWVSVVLGIEPLRRRGTAVELLAVERSRIGLFPEGFAPSADHAGLVLGSLTSLRALRDGLRVLPGHRVLIVGGGGAVGVAAIQLARLLGATADAVCGSAASETVLALGASKSFDHRSAEDVNQALSGSYDAVLVAAGDPVLWLSAARRGGRVAYVDADSGLRGAVKARGSGVSTSLITAGNGADDLSWLAAQMASGLLKPVVGQRYAITDIQRAHAELGTLPTCGARVIDHQAVTGLAP